MNSGSGFPPPEAQSHPYRLRLTSDSAEVQALQNFRFRVFNREPGEAEEGFSTGAYEESFDEVCDHLIVEEKRTGELVGAYRLQTGLMALANRDYQYARLFDFEPFDPFRRQIIELGRPCVHLDHRNLDVFRLLWQGIAAYAERFEARYLISCHSVISQDPEVGAAVFSHLSRRHLAPPDWQTRPWPAFACPLDSVSPAVSGLDALLADYLASGAKVCAAPALDRHFGTIEFLTLFDLGAQF